MVLGIAATIALYVIAGKRGERKRREWFESVAAAFGARAEHTSEFLSKCDAEVDERRCEITHRYGRRTGWRLAATIPLHGVPDIYSLALLPSDDPADNGVRVRNHGFNAREGWLSADVRAAVAHFYEVAPRRFALDLEAGALTCQATDRVDGAAFRDRVSRLVPVANALERAL